MYQDLSFMTIPLPEDVLKLKIYGDYAGAQKMIRYFLKRRIFHRRLENVWKSNRKSLVLWVEMNIHLHMMKHWRL